ncbi:MAG: FtsX-like permease family protein [Alphaproteobacteria bacterium]|nr:FtsX-like permease family protein [Alphaproteobacteria bacterium]MCL2889971.1 FtsX-like permease family protein [Alphaproteobacteria bacterium]
MKKQPLVFSFVKQQRTFLMALMGLLSFLAVLCLGLVISLGTAVQRWNQQWELMATIQIMPNTDTAPIQRLLAAERANIAQSREILAEESARMLSAWLSSGSALTQYIPTVIELKFKSRRALTDMRTAATEISGVRFISFAEGMKTSTRAGWKIIALAALVLTLVLGAVVLCISYITQNITLIHRRELEILNQVGARDRFVARQLMTIIAQITAIATATGFLAAAPILFIIIAMARSFRTGMFTQMSIPAMGWAILLGLAIAIVILAVFTARRTVMGILKSA